MILRIVKMLNPEIVFDVKHLPMTRDSLAEAQKADLSLSKYFNDIQNSDSTNNKDTMYFIENGLLLRRWPLSVFKAFRTNNHSSPLGARG